MKGLILLSSISFFTLCGCAKKAPAQDTGALTYLALGDSYTIGQSVSQDQSFPYQLTAQLNQQSKVNAPNIVAVTGWTTNNLINGINNSGLTSSTYDFVTLLIGVNDQYQGVSQDSYRARFIALLNTAMKFAKGNKNRVFVISIPDYSVTPYAAGSNTDAIAKEIDQFNAINKAESDKAGVNYLNITDISRQAATDGTLLAPDGLHPSGKMYGLWVQRLFPLVKSKI
jgi:lysophospholipase L1-like esterase